MESKRFLIAAGLSLLVLVLWQWIFPAPPPVQPGPESPATAATEDGSSARQEVEGAEPVSGAAQDGGFDQPDSGGGEDQDVAEAPVVAVEPIGATSEEEVVLESEEWRATFTNRGAVLRSLVLLNRLTADDREVEMVRERSKDDVLPFGLVDSQGAALGINDALFAVERSRNSVSFVARRADGTEVSKRFEVDGQGDLKVEVSGSVDGWNLFLGPGVRNPSFEALDDRFQRRSREVVYAAGASVERLRGEELESPAEVPGSVSFVSLQDKYFLSAFQNLRGAASLRVQPVTLLGDADAGLQGYELVQSGKGHDQPVGTALLLEPQGERLELSSFWGAKEYVELKRRGDGLAATVDWGFFGFIAKPLLYGLRWLHDNVTTNYGWCIVLMTFLLRILLLPLTHTSFVSMQKMQQVNPKMEAIRAKYRSKLKDKQGRPNFEQQQKMNQEIQQMFREEGVNPAAGCLPLFLQMPIFFAFYQLLAQAVELWGAPWALWIHDLSVRDPYYVLPLIMGATQLLQQRLMPAPPNPTQRMIMTTMPLMFTVFALNFPAGLVLYWLTNNLLTIVQQGGYNRLKKSGKFGGAEPAKA